MRRRISSTSIRMRNGTGHRIYCFRAISRGSRTSTFQMFNRGKCCLPELRNQRLHSNAPSSRALFVNYSCFPSREIPKFSIRRVRDEWGKGLAQRRTEIRSREVEKYRWNIGILLDILLVFERFSPPSSSHLMFEKLYDTMFLWGEVGARERWGESKLEGTNEEGMGIIDTRLDNCMRDSDWNKIQNLPSF